MREEKMFRVGRLTIEGDLIEFAPEATLEFEVGRRDVVGIGLTYAYREWTEDKESAHIRFTAGLEGQRAESIDAKIGDNPLLDDSRRGFVSVPVHGLKPGLHKGRYTIEAEYGAGPWTQGTTTQARVREEGTFVLRVV